MRCCRLHWQGSSRLLGLISMALLLLGGGATPRSVGAQGAAAQTAGRPTGFRLEGTVSLGRPYLGGDGETFVDPFGHFGFGAGGAIGLGVDGRRFGVTGSLDVSHTTLNGAGGTAVALALVLQWSPAVQALGSWQPLVSAGYVRQAVVADDVSPEGGDGGPGVTPHDVGLKGDGLRVGVGLEHRIGHRATVTVGLTGDFMSFDTASLDDADNGLRDPGWSIYPRLAVGLRVWPFAH